MRNKGSVPIFLFGARLSDAGTAAPGAPPPPRPVKRGKSPSTRAAECKRSASPAGSSPGSRRSTSPASGRDGFAILPRRISVAIDVLPAGFDADALHAVHEGLV